jgi:hypothetical protein
MKRLLLSQKKGKTILGHLGEHIYGLIWTNILNYGHFLGIYFLGLIVFQSHKIVD